MHLVQLFGKRFLRTLIGFDIVVRPLLFLREYLLGPFMPGAGCAIRYQDAVLLVRHTYGDRLWRFPAGVAARGEKMEDTVKREIFEEVGVRLTAVELLTVRPYRTKMRPRPVSFFRAVVTNPSVVIDELEIAEARWFPWRSLPPLSQGAYYYYELLCQYENRLGSR